MDEKKTVTSETGEQKSRRAFVKTAAQAAVTAPAVVLLLDAATKPANAQAAPYGVDTLPPPR